MIRRLFPRLARCRVPGSLGLLAVFLGSMGCINDDIALYEVRIRGSVSAPGLPAERGTLHLEFHHQQSFGRGALAHPLGEIDRRSLPAPTQPLAIDETLLYPTGSGEGLVIYGWLDRDGDGILCAPGQTAEPAGLVLAAGFPAHDLTIDLTLNQPCAGAERLYP